LSFLFGFLCARLRLSPVRIALEINFLTFFAWAIPFSFEILPQFATPGPFTFCTSSILSLILRARSSSIFKTGYKQRIQNHQQDDKCGDLC